MLPTDYKEFIDIYGSGLFCKFLAVWNFRDPSYFKKDLREALCGEGGIIQWYKTVRSTGGYQWPYSMYPEPEGLLPFAMVIDVHNLNWHTAGPPDKWDIILWFSDGHEFIHLRGDTFAKCLLKMLRNEYQMNDVLQLDPPFEFTLLSAP